jgi:hypothetical protein
MRRSLTRRREDREGARALLHAGMRRSPRASRRLPCALPTPTALRPPAQQRCSLFKGNGVSPVELTFEADFRGGITKGAGLVCFRRGSVLSAVVILAGGLSGRRQRIPWRSRGGICRVCERWRKAVSSDGNSLPLRPSVIFAAILPGLRPKGLTRRREDAKKGGADGLLFGEDVPGEMSPGGFQNRWK